MEELAQIFGEMGFTVEEGPDIETDFNNFTALNFPPNHPARETHDTFFLNATDEDGARKVLRTHTSPGAGAHHAEAEAADPHDLHGPHLPQGLRRHAHADVPPDRRPRHRRDHDAWPISKAC